MKSNPRCKYGYLSCFDVDVIKKTKSSNEQLKGERAYFGPQVQDKIYHNGEVRAMGT